MDTQLAAERPELAGRLAYRRGRLFKAEFGVPPSAVRQLRTADGEHGA
ncbi:hypothetical protein [Variovorax sp. WS11]|nr:hypothetical protein [Variovorax sp. WS11]NDZ17308.1 hypothetical protein [Variovorax sp. WS11]